MVKKLKKTMAAFLAMVLCVGSFSTTAFATEATDADQGTPDSSTVWYGGEMSVPVTAGTDGYTFQSVYTSPRHAYEMSNHMLSPDGGASNDIPQTLVLVDARKDYTWTPNGLYEMGKSNYEVLFCCDAETGYQNGVHYKRLNLEDSDYYSAEDAAHIRAIITNSYPYISMEEMKADLKADGFADADLLTRAEIISAVQAAVWAYANDNVGPYVYSQTFDVPTNSQWGTVMHDYTNEMEVWWNTGKRVFTTKEEVGARINALAEHLKSKTATYAEKHQIVVSDVKFVEIVPVQEEEGFYNVLLQVALNNSGSSNQDALDLTIYVDGEKSITDKITWGCEQYVTTIKVKDGQTVKAEVSGSQFLPQGVYFYEPEGGRTVSQCLVGIAAGRTDIFKAAEVTLDMAPKTADLILQKEDQNGEPLSGAAFTLYVKGEEHMVQYGDIYEVDENGRLVLENLLPGEYKLVETTVPTGYLAPTEDILFEVDEEGVMTVQKSRSMYMKDGVMHIVNRKPDAAVVLTIDMSGTMYNNKMDGSKEEHRYVNVAKAKAIEFVTQYAASSNNGGKRMLAVVCFDTDAKIQQGWIDVSVDANELTAINAINSIKVADNGDPSSKKVCTNFDGGVILSRNLLKQSKIEDIDRCFNIILSDGAPTVTVPNDSTTVDTIESNFGRKDQTWVVNGVTKTYQSKNAGGGWTHPAEVTNTLTYLKGVKDETCNYTVNDEKKEGIFIVGVGGLMDFKLFYDAVYGTSNGTRTADVEKKPAAFNNVDALEGYTSDQIMQLTTGDWMTILANKVNGTYVSAANSAALAAQFDVLIDAIVETTALPEEPLAVSYNLRSGAAVFAMRMGAVDDEPVVDEPVVDEPIVDDPVIEKPAPEKPAPEKPAPEKPAPEKPAPGKPGPAKPEAEKPAPEKPAPEGPAAKEPTLNVEVKGGKVSSWIVTDEGVTAVYIAAKGKEPAVIWTSEEVDADTLASIIEELDADADAVILSSLGTHQVEYQHNKNKTKTVTYTFEEAKQAPAKPKKK